MGMVSKIVGIAIGLFVAAIIMPLALTELADATLTNVSPAVTTVFTVLLPVLAIVGLAMYFVPRRG